MNGYNERNLDGSTTKENTSKQKEQKQGLKKGLRKL